MEKRTTKQKVFQSILYIGLMIFVFISVLFVKMANNAEYVGYFKWDSDIIETTGEEIGYVKQPVRKASYTDDIDIYNTYYIIDDEMYIIEKDINNPDDTGKLRYVKTTTVNSRDVIESNTKLDTEIVIVVIDFFSVENFEKTVKDPNYWVLSILITATMTLGYITVFLYKRDNYLDADEYQNLVAQYNDTLSLKPLNFDTYIHENNIREKKKVYIEKVNKKIARIQARLDRLSFKPRITKRNEKSIQKYTKLIEMYNQMINDEYLNKHILGLRVMFKPLHADVYTRAIGADIHSRKDKSNEKSVMTLLVIRKTITGLLTAILFTALVWTAYFTLEFNAGFWFTVIITIISTLTNVVFALAQARKMYKQNYYGILIVRIGVLEDAVRWAINNPSNDKTFDTIISEYTSKQVADETAKIKQKYDESLNQIQTQFENLKSKHKE